MHTKPIILNIQMKIIKTIIAASALAATLASCDKAEPTSYYTIQVALPDRKSVV